jgi:hypothetical protein
MPDWKERLKFCEYKAQESGALQRLPEKNREDQKLIARGSPPVLVN